MQVAPPGIAVTVYAVMGEPFDAAAVHVTNALLSAGVAIGAAGTAGIPIGVALAPADAGLLPAELCATTVKVYVTPTVSLVTVQVSAPVVVQVLFPGLEVAVYFVTAAVPGVAGADHATVTLWLPAVAVTFCGALGATLTTGVAVGSAAASAATLETACISRATAKIAVVAAVGMAPWPRNRREIMMKSPLLTLHQPDDPIHHGSHVRLAAQEVSGLSSVLRTAATAMADDVAKVRKRSAALRTAPTAMADDVAKVRTLVGVERASAG